MLRAFLASFVFVIALAGCHSPKSDFERLCKVADEVTKDNAVARPDKPSVIQERFEKQGMARSTRACIDLAFGPGLDVGRKYAILEQCARKAGADGWSCPSLRDHWAAPGPPVIVEP